MSSELTAPRATNVLPTAPTEPSRYALRPRKRQAGPEDVTNVAGPVQKRARLDGGPFNRLHPLELSKPRNQKPSRSRKETALRSRSRTQRQPQSTSATVAENHRAHSAAQIGHQLPQESPAQVTLQQPSCYADAAVEHGCPDDSERPGYSTSKLNSTQEKQRTSDELEVEDQEMVKCAWILVDMRRRTSAARALLELRYHPHPALVVKT
ncbi:hypothetical protein OBBRIDRAFT_803214 [Obba rivulosa]|uniref:Uncharacterized protein n=1 Tax=Obba rivulosa TaxID=1052685 RepID=A0A8E2AWD1_9APHY|nr:hypothetical protein OBBRIDRAFT_803214 [Obba rivulosa]